MMIKTNYICQIVNIAPGFNRGYFENAQQSNTEKHMMIKTNYHCYPKVLRKP
jgi:hypothetical protein